MSELTNVAATTSEPSDTSRARPSTRDQIVAIIPARGGSKGIPGKNLKPVAGKPLIAWTIEHALASPSIGRVIVSTDSEEIAAVSRQYGAEVVMRPAELADDEATSESALEHALDQLDTTPELVVFLQCTSPVRDDLDTENAIATLRMQDADSLFSARPHHGFIWHDFLIGPAPTYDTVRRPRRQDVPPQLIENGSIYIFKPEVLRGTGSRLGWRIAVHRMSAECSVEVDEPEDLAIVEVLLRMRMEGAGQ